TIPDLATNPNFPINAFLLLLHLPAEEEYMPPIRLRVLDTRDFGYRPEVGQACVRGLGQYCCQPHGQGQPHGPRTPLPSFSTKEEEDEDEGDDDWWSKFYVAMGDKAKSRRGTNRNRLKIYSCELEAVPEFEGLQDFCQTFPLYQPGGHPTAGEDPVPVGEFKGLFRIYPLPEDPQVPPPPRHFQELPPSQPQMCLVRVYVVRAFDLPPRDRNGLCDPYIRISLGTKTLGQRDQYVPNTLEPVFGRLFEVTATIPLEKDLRVSLLDYDLVPPDQDIGTTTIDLENRLLSRFRAHCGLPALYRTDPRAGGVLGGDGVGGCQGGDGDLTVTGTPGQEGDAGVTRTDAGGRDRDPRGLMETQQGPWGDGDSRVTRSQPGRDPGGKVQMWVDIFPASLGPPGPPVDISPRKPQRYELRCVVWNTRDVDLGDTNMLGQRMSDIYVTGWLDGLEEQKQRTDVHYRSLQGDGAFNWRFVFSFEYLAAEQLCILPRKEHFWSLDETVLKVPPKLILQVWDNDKFSADDFLGVLELELTKLPQPAQQPQACTPTPQGPPQSPWPWRGTRVPSRFSLFRQRRVRGWWPCTVQEGSKRRLSGKLELSLEVLTAKEAEERPVGKGREDPNMYPTLPAPVRPEWSFLWVQAPLRSLRYSLCRRHCGRLSLALALLLLLGLLLTFIYATPVSATCPHLPPSLPAKPPATPQAPFAPSSQGYLAMKLVNPLPTFHLGGGEQPKGSMGKP
uniref:C2 domain-containing protein n=1 Tax=Otus sunia TaxID=257818 RepID=A0A8C8AXX4_9STRI